MVQSYNSHKLFATIYEELGPVLRWSPAPENRENDGLIKFWKNPRKLFREGLRDPWGPLSLRVQIFFSFKEFSRKDKYMMSCRRALFAVFEERISVLSLDCGHDP